MYEEEIEKLISKGNLIYLNREEKMRETKIYNEKYCAACYFRTIAEYPKRKCLIQLTEKCNLCCEHCFVSANNIGQEMDLKKIKDNILPQLLKNNIAKVTLTGGELFVYTKLSDVVELLIANNIAGSICTNATLITETFLERFKDCGDLHFNVSLDGFSSSSHGKFRGNQNPELYNTIISNIKLLGNKGLLNGVLVTPNVYSSVQEYVELCEFAKTCHAKYVLMNPLSQFGRGEKTIKLAFDNQQMGELRQATKKFNGNDMEMVYIRFPNSEKKPLSECVAGKVMYIFTNGDIAFCPYMVFAAKDSSSLYDSKEFIIGNIFTKDFDWKKSLDDYNFPVNYNEVCLKCDNQECKKGCYAAKISQGSDLSKQDGNLCPLENE